VGARWDRFTEAARGALLQGQTTWSTLYLRDKDPRFQQVWDVVRLIPGWFEEVNAAAQFLVLAELRPKTVVEIGSYLGRSTVFYAKSMQVLGVDATVTAIDPHTGDRQHLLGLGVRELPSFELFQSHLEAAGVSDMIRPVVEKANDVVGEWSEPIDFLFIDGWHSYDAVLEDGHRWIPHLSDRSVAVFDDATRYPDVRRAIDDLVADGTVHLYGDAFGQAFAGRHPDDFESIRTVLHSYRPLTRYVPGHRSVR